jgi:hypothetical protein
MKIATLALSALGSLVLLLQPGLGFSQEVNPHQDGVEVQARGPVHEAFAEPALANPQPSPIVPKAPPEPVPEIPPDQKPEGDNVQWITGYWAWDAQKQDYLWVSGIWRVTPPGRQWVPGHWAQVDGGWQWASGLWAAADQQQVQFLEPPPDSLDNGPSIPAPTEDSLYVPGTWVPRESQYWWRPGFWMNARANWIWNPASYVWSPSGYIFNDGFWDYPLANRGILFSPVQFVRPLWLRPGWFYRPYYAVNLASFLDCLFVRPQFGHYYFGDYFAPTYWGQGFHPWYAFGPRFYDPLFNYYRWHYRGNPGWLPGLRNAYWARRNEVWERPPRTLAGINRLPRDQVPIVAPFRQVARTNLTNITGNQVAHFRTQANAMRNLSVQRTQVEKPASFTAHRSGNQPGRDIRAGNFHLPTATAGIRPASVDHVVRRAEVTPNRTQPLTTRSFYQGDNSVYCNPARPAAPSRATTSNNGYSRYRPVTPSQPTRRAAYQGSGNRAVYRPSAPSARSSSHYSRGSHVSHSSPRPSAPHHARSTPSHSGGHSSGHAAAHGGKHR